MKHQLLVFLILPLIIFGCKKKELEVDLDYNIYDVDYKGEPFLFIDSIATYKSELKYSSSGNYFYYIISNYFYVRHTASSKNYNEFVIRQGSKIVHQGGNPNESDSEILVMEVDYVRVDGKEVYSIYKPGTEHIWELCLSLGNRPPLANFISYPSESFSYVQPQIY